MSNMTYMLFMSMELELELSVKSALKSGGRICSLHSARLAVLLPDASGKHARVHPAGNVVDLLTLEWRALASDTGDDVYADIGRLTISSEGLASSLGMDNRSNGIETVSSLLLLYFLRSKFFLASNLSFLLPIPRINRTTELCYKLLQTIRSLE